MASIGVEAMRLMMTDISAATHTITTTPVLVLSQITLLSYEHKQRDEGKLIGSILLQTVPLSTLTLQYQQIHPNKRRR